MRIWIILVRFLSLVQSEKIVIPEWKGTTGENAHTIVLKEEMASIHFRQVGNIAHSQDTAFLSFQYQLKPLITKTYSLYKHCNFTQRIASENSAYRKAENVSALYALQAYHLYNSLRNSLLTWETKDPGQMDSLVKIDETIKNSSHKLHPNVNGKYSKEDYLAHMDYVKQMNAMGHNITKRQVVAGLVGAGALAGISYVADKLGLTELLGLKDNTAEKLHVALGDVNHRFNVDEKRTTMLEDDLAKVTRAEDQLINRGIFTRLLESLEAHLEDVRMEVNAALRGMAALLTKTLSPDLIPFELVGEGLELLIKELEKKGLTPILSSTAQIFSLPCSHIIDHHTLEIFVVIRVPVHQSANKLQLFHYVDFPAQVGPNQFIIPRPTYEFIAVNNLRSTFKELTSGDLLLCDHTPELYICPSHAIDVKAEETCLVALFTGQGKGIKTYCPYHQATRDAVLQKRQNQFQIFFKEMQTITFSCQDSHSVLSRSFQGIRELTLPDGCKAETNAFVFESTKSLHGHTIPLRVQQLPYLSTKELQPQEGSLMETVADLEQAMKETSLRGQQDTLMAQADMEKTMTSGFDMWKHGPMTIILVLFALIGLGFSIWGCCWCRRECLALKSATTLLPDPGQEMRSLRSEDTAST